MGNYLEYDYSKLLEEEKLIGERKAKMEAAIVFIKERIHNQKERFTEVMRKKGRERKNEMNQCTLVNSSYFA